MKLYSARRRCLAALTVGVALLTSGHAFAQEHELPLHVKRSTILEGPLLVMPSDASAPGEAYGDDLPIRVLVEDDFRAYVASHDGVTCTLHVALEAPLQYVTLDIERNLFEPLAPGLRVGMGNYGLLDGIVTAAGDTGGKAYPMLGFAIVYLPLQANAANAGTPSKPCRA